MTRARAQNASESIAGGLSTEELADCAGHLIDCAPGCLAMTDPAAVCAVYGLTRAEARAELQRRTHLPL